MRSIISINRVPICFLEASQKCKDEKSTMSDNDDNDGIKDVLKQLSGESGSKVWLQSNPPDCKDMDFDGLIYSNVECSHSAYALCIKRDCAFTDSSAANSNRKSSSIYVTGTGTALATLVVYAKLK